MLGNPGTWLYVTVVLNAGSRHVTDCANTTGLPQAASNEPSSHQDADIRLSIGDTRTSRVMDGQGQEQEWSLPHIASTKDGGVRRIHQCSPWPRLDQYTTKALLWPHEFEGQDSADSCQQSNGTSFCRITISCARLTT